MCASKVRLRSPDNQNNTTQFIYHIFSAAQSKAPTILGIETIEYESKYRKYESRNVK